MNNYIVSSSRPSRPLRQTMQALPQIASMSKRLE